MFNVNIKQLLLQLLLHKKIIITIITISTRIHFQVLVKRAWLGVTWEISIMQVPR